MRDPSVRAVRDAVTGLPAPQARRGLDRPLRTALARARRSVPAPARGAWSVHPLKSRARRWSVLVGYAEPVAGAMEVRWGIVVKGGAPERVVALAERHARVHAALEHPRAPRLIATHPRAGWLALEAFPGMPLARVGDGRERDRLLAEVAGDLARLEQTSAAAWPQRRWGGSDEAARLDDVWARTGGAPPSSLERLRSWLIAQPAGVPAHRDLYADQVIVHADRAGAWIDWDEAALAPAGLDLGNLLAHEHVHSAREAVHHAYHASGGGADAIALARWEAAACLRLAGLALQRAAGDDPIERNPAWIPAPAASVAAAAHWMARAEALIG